MSGSNQKVQKVYYRIGEVAAMFKVNVSLIRYWEREFSIIKPYRNKKGTRFFTPKDVENFNLIHHLVKERGFTLQGARDYLSEKKITDANPDFEIIRTLENLRTFLLSLKEEL
ncbi:MAG: MerR family transcriptional regulator [Lentimicrobium sp.]|jgi:DNA-binding transcriptional MerR regulator|nr:MerR family transcriptional regulator [Lentimicrobium sp.]MDD2526457.1 MerR family transcriptional regulator [Lentimicrobiaceae bacterium]MDD4596408.1 MerR family transcriptional regulator [Lentimicrobiaceae bacterium]MDY0026507.1 MerR family transcriptional regulator [Lentimicrobium sp.]HAH56802.1 MerR family transcriptional regulator [Bacteroidales bacterium]